MSDSFVGEVRLAGFTFAPVGWSTCLGQTLSIAGNEALFNLIGTTYGGNGQTDFNLPNLAGRVAVHQGTLGTDTYVMGQTGGVENVGLIAGHLPSHNHALMASTNTTGGVNSPAGNVVGAAVSMFSPLSSGQSPNEAMSSSMITSAPGGTNPHNNMQPYLVLNWIISLSGIYPST